MTAMSGRLQSALTNGLMPLFVAAWMAGCSDPAPPERESVTAPHAVSDSETTRAELELRYREQRRAMVEHQLRDRDIVD